MAVPPLIRARSAGSMAATGSDTRDGWLMPHLLTARTRKTKERPSTRPVTGKRANLTGVSLHWIQWLVPTSHLQGDRRKRLGCGRKQDSSYGKKTGRLANLSTK